MEFFVYICNLSGDLNNKKTIVGGNKMKIHHICIQTNNYKESLDFYVGVLGFKLLKEEENFHNRDYNSWLILDGFYIELQTDKKGEKLKVFNKVTEGVSHICFSVDDLYDQYKLIKEKGYLNFISKSGSEIYQVEGASLFKLIAPEGTIIEFRDNVRL